MQMSGEHLLVTGSTVTHLNIVIPFPLAQFLPLCYNDTIRKAGE